jgi:26S proteasome regulatory subunit N1
MTDSLCSIGIAYAGTRRQDILDRILPIATDTGLSMEITSMASLAIGFIYVGSADGDVAGSFLQTMMEREDKELDEKWARYLSLALGLLYLSRFGYFSGVSTCF